jgi:hypothetical protein
LQNQRGKQEEKGTYAAGREAPEGMRKEEEGKENWGK